MRYTLLLILLAFQALGQQKWPDAFEISKDTIELIVPSDKILILKNASKSLTFEDVIKSMDFEIHANLQQNNATVCWAKLKVKNNLAKRVESLISNNTSIYDLYFSKDSINWFRLKTGMLRAESQRDSSYDYIDNFRLPLIFEPNEQYYLVIKSEVPFWSFPIRNLTLAIQDKEKIQKYFYVNMVKPEYYQNLVISGIFIGLFLFSILLNLLMHFGVREKSYLFFSISILAILLSRFGSTLSTLFKNEFPYLLTVLIKLSFPVFCVAFSLFIIRLIRSKQSNKKILLATNILLCLSVLAYLLSEFIPSIAIQNVTFYLFRGYLSRSLFVVLSIFLYVENKKGNIQARYAIYGLFPLVFLWIYQTVSISLNIFLNQTKVYISDLVFSSFENFAFLWMSLLLLYSLFNSYNQTKKELSKSLIEKEKIAKEKEIEKNLILESQKDLLENQVKARTSELQKTIETLKSTQDQLVQKEKLASLGELTAGIAHEIQNPLNFVNNFSELSGELIEELKELENSDDKELKAELLSDLAENQQKINHHGKRASNIVKGMLAHSRASSGEKSLTNINELADEYLRLSFHGMRAKDKSFNADFKLQADPTIPELNIVPQDIGRVLLNLINNAFYSVFEKSRLQITGYKPLVEVQTEKTENQVIIKVKDNGLGISDEVKTKVFQPFFTTKPSGEGTGLGLSLSYDIVTKGHKGELTVQSETGEYCEFIITLPIL